MIGIVGAARPLLAKAGVEADEAGEAKAAREWRPPSLTARDLHETMADDVPGT